MENIFLSKPNMNILKEILFTELNVNNNSVLIHQINEIFEKSIVFFLKNTNLNNNSLIKLNKLFLKQTMLTINKLIPNLNQINSKVKININEQINYPHKIEDIKEIKQNLFDEEFNLMKNDFETSMNNKQPETIDFSDKYNDQKISNMDELLSNIITKRGNDVPIKMIVVEDQTMQPPQVMQNKKKISFNLDEENDKGNAKDEDGDGNNDILNKTFVYEEQESIALSKIDIQPQQPMQPIQTQQPKPLQSIQTQLLPIHELIKIINQFNEKIDRFEENINEKINQLEKNIDEKFNQLEKNIDEKFNRLEKNIDEKLIEYKRINKLSD